MKQWELNIMSACLHSCFSYSAWSLHLFSVAMCVCLWPVRLYHFFCTLCHKKSDFLEEVTKHKMCALIFSTSFVWNISHSKENSASYFHKWNKPVFFRRFFEKFLNIKFHSNPPMGADFFHADRQTDRHDKLTVACHSFADAPKNLFMTKWNWSAKHCREWGYEI